MKGVLTNGDKCYGVLRRRYERHSAGAKSSSSPESPGGASDPSERGVQSEAVEGRSGPSHGNRERALDLIGVWMAEGRGQGLKGGFLIKRAQAAVEAPEKTPKKWMSKQATRSVEDIKKLKLITAIKTPYLPSGRIDLEAYDNLVERQIDGGAEGLIVGGTTGEGHLMTWDEHIMLIAHTAKHYGHRIAVIGNTGSNNTAEAVHATCQGFAVGMDASLQINPYYGKTSPQGIKKHFEAVLDYGPTILYNVPGRTGQDIPDDVVHALASEYPAFSGIKECTGLDRIERHASKGLHVWSGNDDDCHDARHQRGAQGVVSVTSNAAPSIVSALMETRDDALRDEVLPLMEWIFAQPNPIGINTLSAMMRVAKPIFRLPYLPFSKDDRVEGKRIVENLGLHRTIADSVDVLEDSDFMTIP